MARPMLKWIFLSGLALCMSLGSLQAQTQNNIVTVDHIAAVSGLKAHAPMAMPTSRQGSREALAIASASPFAGSASANAALNFGGLRFPGDLQNHGGPIIGFAQNHSVFMNPTAACAPNSCFGDPIGFLNDLGRSQFIHVTDQYVNTRASNRYTNGTNYAVSGYPPSAGAGSPFTDLDLAIVAYSLASQTSGFGYNHIYHLFLTPGQDVCFDSTFSVCYSPDNFNTWFFCAYHGAVEDNAGNIALYSVEPFQNVSGCSARPDGPNGQVADSTNNVLSHEVVETITDPLGDAWWNQLNNALFGEEIADECSFIAFTPSGVFFDPSVVRLNHKLYALQPEYTNFLHACSANGL